MCFLTSQNRIGVANKCFSNLNKRYLYTFVYIISQFQKVENDNHLANNSNGKYAEMKRIVPRTKLL